jgi:hypothetical protein
LCSQVSQGLSVGLDNSIEFLAPSQLLQGQLQKQQSVDTNNYITEKRKYKGKSLKASFGNRTVENLPFLCYTTKRSMKIIRTRKAIPINTKVVTRKPITMIIVRAVK